jgi:site-specific recombinase XerD
MSIKKQPNGQYLLNFRPDGVKGKQVKKLFSTKSAALAHQKKVLSEPGVMVKDKRTFADLVALWFDYHGHSLKSSEDSKNRLLKFAEAVGNPLAVAVDGALFAQYRQSRISQGISPATLNRELSTIKAVYSELLRLGLWSVDAPILSVRKFKEVKRELSYLTQAQIELLITEAKASSNASLYPVVMVCLATGARWSEAEGLTLSVLDSINCGVHFLDTKNGLNRFVPLGHSTFKLVQDYLSVNGSFASCYSAFRSALERTKIDTLDGQSAHILRHTFASHFIMNGGNLLTLQKILGHSSLQMTMRYAHLASDYLQDAVKFNPLVALNV